MRELEFQVSHHGADRVPQKKKDIDETARNGGGDSGGGGGTQKTQIYTAGNIIF